MSVKDFFADSIVFTDEVTALKNAADNAYSIYMKSALHPNEIGIISNDTMYINYLKLKTDLMSSVSKLMEYKREVLKIINIIENPSYRLILECRYINRMTFEKIAEQTNYDERNIYRIHKKAIDEVDKKLSCSTLFS